MQIIPNNVSLGHPFTSLARKFQRRKFHLILNLKLNKDMHSFCGEYRLPNNLTYTKIFFNTNTEYNILQDY